jgi:N-acyl-D-aspartate/D-glutamate deacylase
VRTAREPAEARERLDANGPTVAPGFIDVHTHGDNVGQTTRREPLAWASRRSRATAARRLRIGEAFEDPGRASR